MNAQDRVNFIKNIDNKEEKSTTLKCTKCGSMVGPQDKFCESCGAPLKEFVAMETEEKEKPQVEVNKIETEKETETISDENITNLDSAPSKSQKREVVKEADYTEPSSAFALGLPSWSLEPPQVVVRKRRI